MARSELENKRNKLLTRLKAGQREKIRLKAQKAELTFKLNALKAETEAFKDAIKLVKSRKSRLGNKE